MCRCTCHLLFLCALAAAGPLHAALPGPASQRKLPKAPRLHIPPFRAPAPRAALSQAPAHALAAKSLPSQARHALVPPFRVPTLSFKEYLRQADQLYEAKEYDRAIAAWDRAQALKPTPVLFLAVAQAHEVAGRPEPALVAYEAFVAKVKRGPQARQAKVRIAALHAVLGMVDRVVEHLQQRGGPAPSAPLVDAGAGLILGGRYFTFDEQDPPSPVRCYDLTGPDAKGLSGGMPQAACPRFHSTVVSGLRLDATVFPLARAKIVGVTGLPLAAVRGLGVGGTVDLFFWPSSTLPSAGQSVSLATGELRAEVGLRWVFPVLPRLGIAVRGVVQYGLHQFTLAKQGRTIPDPADPTKTLTVTDNHGLPDIRYQYLDLGAGVRLPYYGNSRLFLGTVIDLRYHAVLAYGEIAARFVDQARQDGGYGPVERGYGLRLDWVPLEVQAFRGLTVRAQVYYERFGMQFTLADAAAGYPLPPAGRIAAATAQHFARGATDQYFGGALQAAYQF